MTGKVLIPLQNLDHVILQRSLTRYMPRRHRLRHDDVPARTEDEGALQVVESAAEQALIIASQ